MWSNLSLDILASIFSYLSPDSLARARSACRHWNTCAEHVNTSEMRRRHPPWLVALPTRNLEFSCYSHNPIDNNWHILSINGILNPTKPIASIGGLILLRATNTTVLRLAMCNPFTAQLRHLPMLNVSRTNPAVGVIDTHQDVGFPNFKIYVAGGMSEMPSGGASYEPTLETYDPVLDNWRIIGTMPVEFAVRLTVWTPNESVYSNGVLYWMTSARVYSVMGFDIFTKKWKELTVPMADRLDFAALVPRNGKLTLVGGMPCSDACIWELGEDENWCMIEKVPVELKMKFLGRNRNWHSTKCVGIDGAVCLYKDLGSGMVMWRKDIEKGGRWEWHWIEGCCLIKGKEVTNLPVKGLFLHPNLAP